MSAKPEKPKSDALKYGNLARQFIEATAFEGHPTVVHWQGTFWFYRDRGPQAGLYSGLGFGQATNTVLRWLLDREITSSRDTAENVTHCVAALRQLTGGTQMPFWLPDEEGNLPEGRASDWLVTANGMVCPTRVAAGDDHFGLLDHTPRWFSTTKLPHNYQPEAKCPRWDAFLRERFEGDPKAALLLQQFFGYCLTYDTRRHAFLLIVGEAGRGKSLICDVLQDLLGHDNVETMQLAEMKAQFRQIALRGKLLALLDDISPKMSADIEAYLKRYVSGQRVSADKKHADGVNFQPTARILMNANEWPEFGHRSDGIWRRLHVINLEKPLPGAPDIYLRDKLKTEMPGILNWAIRGLGYLNQTGKFAESSLGSALKVAEKEESQNYKRFVADKLVADPTEEAVVSRAALMLAYKIWCGGEGESPSATLKDLLGEVRRTIPAAVDCRKMVNGRQTRGLSGVRLLP